MANMVERLRDHGDRDRVTVFWCCGDKVLCTTGHIVEASDDFVLIKGRAPTAAETRSCDCKDLETERLITLIVAKHICGVVFDVPDCRKAALPVCCPCEDRDHKKCDCRKDCHQGNREHRCHPYEDA